MLTLLSFMVIIILSYIFNSESTSTDSYTLSLHDALPICFVDTCFGTHHPQFGYDADDTLWLSGSGPVAGWVNTKDRKSTRLNSSHQIISYAVFCLKKKKSTSISYQGRYAFR